MPGKGSVGEPAAGSPAGQNGLSTPSGPAYEVVRFCSKCGQPISIDERRFYFMDAEDGSTLCRECLRGVERSSPPAPPRPETLVDLFPRVEVSETPAGVQRSGAVALHPSPRVRSVQEYFLDIDLALLAIPLDAKLAEVVRRLESEAQRRYDAGREMDARRILVSLDAKLEELGFGRHDSDPGAPPAHGSPT